MVNAIVLLKVERNKVNDVAQSLAKTPGVSEVYSVSGEFDLVAMIRVKTNDDLADTVTNRIRNLESILSTTTMLAFRAYSHHNLETMYSAQLDRLP